MGDYTDAVQAEANAAPPIPPERRDHIRTLLSSTSDELAQAIARRQEIIAQVQARHTGGNAPAEMGRGPCSSSGYCGCKCMPCRVGTKHTCGHRKGCHKNCASR